MLDVFDRLLRETVLTIACEMGDPDALKEASNIFNQWINETIRYQYSSGLFVFNFSLVSI